MKRALVFLAGVAVLGASPDPRMEIASRKFLIGTWHCTFTVGNEGGVYTTTWASALDGLWLRQRYDQPKQPRAFAFRAEYLVGYDPVRRGWVRFGAMTTGQYFTVRMTDDGAGGWYWTYVGLLDRRRSPPPPSGYDARFVRESDVLYAIDGPTYANERNVTVTEHHVCHKIVSLPRPIS